MALSTAESGRFLVVGVDASMGAAAALRWAVREAAEHHARVHAVHVRRSGPAAAVLGEEHALDELEMSIVHALGPDDPPVPLVRHLVEGPPGPALCEAARGAELLVLGSHRRGLVGEALLGSVSHHCARHATCPVVIVPVSLLDEAARVFPVTAEAAEAAVLGDYGHA